MAEYMTETHWDVLARASDGTLRWGSAVGACWSLLVRKGYVQSGFGEVTDKGREALTAREGQTDES
jgi:hypothetical protein